MTDKGLKEKVNSRYGVVDIIRTFVTKDFEEIKTGEGYRLHPCPFTGNERKSFALQRQSDGFEVYYMFNTDYVDETYDGVPHYGTAYDMMRGLFPDKNEIQILSILVSDVGQLPERKERTRTPAKKKELVFVDPEIIEGLQKSYIEQLNSIETYRRYLEEICKFETETIDHFMIGCDRKTGVFTYPCVVGGKIKHFRYKLKKNVFNLPHNSGGIWMFNEDGLNGEKVILVEGEHDAMMIWQKYRIDAVAVCGEFSNRSERYKKLKKLEDRVVYLAFDNDRTGKRFTALCYEALSGDNKVKVVEYAGKDPDECIKNGNEIRFE